MLLLSGNIVFLVLLFVVYIYFLFRFLSLMIICERRKMKFERCARNALMHWTNQVKSCKIYMNFTEQRSKVDRDDVEFASMTWHYVKSITREIKIKL